MYLNRKENIELLKEFWDITDLIKFFLIQIIINSTFNKIKKIIEKCFPCHIFTYQILLKTFRGVFLVAWGIFLFRNKLFLSVFRFRVISSVTINQIIITDCPFVYRGNFNEEMVLLCSRVFYIWIFQAAKLNRRM